MTEPVIAYLGLGGNLGDRARTLAAAVADLAETPGLAVTAVSSVIETDPVGGVDQPRYLNAVIEVRTTLAPRVLLDRCLAIERSHGRERSDQERWGPRTLDIDVLLYGTLVHDEPDLQIPHPRMHERTFTLGPLAEIAPHARHPRLGRSVESLADDLVRRLQAD